MRSNRRSLRRHHKKRMRDRFIVFEKNRTFYLSPGSIPQLYVNACKRGDTAANCNCDSCCNPRHSGWTKRNQRPTLQERKMGQPHRFQKYPTAFED